MAVIFLRFAIGIIVRSLTIVTSMIITMRNIAVTSFVLGLLLCSSTDCYEKEEEEEDEREESEEKETEEGEEGEGLAALDAPPHPPPA